jgi:VWFA-related protein
MFFMRQATLPLILMVAAQTAAAQWQKAEADAPQFRTGTALVRVDVRVTEGGRPVKELRQEDFVVTEEGETRKPAGFGQEAEALDVVLVLDVSGSMGRMLRAMAAAGREALAQLRPGDRVAVMLFAGRQRMAVELTPEVALAERALREAALERDLGAGTVLNAALLAVADQLRQQQAPARRRAVVVLTDNGGVHFRSPDEEVVKALAAVNAVVSAVVPDGARPRETPQGADVNPDFTPANVFRIARETGGEVLSGGDAGRRFRELLERIRSSYSLLLKPGQGETGTYRRLGVRLSEEARRRHPRAEVAARPGYYLP